MEGKLRADETLFERIKTLIFIPLGFSRTQLQNEIRFQSMKGLFSVDRSSEFFTVTMWCGGTFQTEGFVCYKGGSKMTFDFVHMRSLNNSTLKKMFDKFGVVGSKKYFLLIGLGFKPLLDDEDIKIRALCHKYGCREMTLYSGSESESGSESGNGNGAESENESEKNENKSGKVSGSESEKNKNESGKGNGSESGKGGDCENENIKHESGNFVGENLDVEENENEQSELERQEDEDDFLDTDYDFRNSSSDDDDALHTLFVPPLPPNFGRGAGRPLKARRRDQEEPKKKGNKRRGKQSMKMKRKQPTVRCKKCGMAGHNARSCEKRKEKEMNTQSQNQSQVTQEVDNSPLKRAFDTILERKRARAVADRGKKKRAKMAKVGTEQSSHNRTLLPPVIRHEEEDEELQSLCELIDEYENPRVDHQPGPTPYQQLQSSMKSRDEN
ncbi:arginine/serine-rich zinc knuckle-containing protein 33 [Striga asiatica]|uniref:Arginine/serine-rich zinc knuckle-containing protein 33 n=1 Tax=Striga asiatica TaxID=4170 RepID=A0A5A7QR56_STRAF|nr:arginine/serine-rich zinc knuckle-containing protein 33 [Striga asiatica]